MPAEPVLTDPRSAPAGQLLAAARAYYSAILNDPLDGVLTADQLAAPGIAFFLLADGDRPVACAALARRDGYGEIKAMWVDPLARGRGHAAALLARIESEARSVALPFLRLETHRQLAPAIRLYLRHGFQPCPPFGDYTDVPASAFLEKRLG